MKVTQPISQRPRQPEGKMLVLIIAILALILIPLMFFTLNYVSFLRGYQQEQTATEAAALAAADDLSKVVIDDPNFGLIGLTDVPAVGKTTVAADNFFMPVTGINSLLATVRLGMILADEFDDKTLQACARLDYDHALFAKDDLVRTMSQAIQPGSTFRDIDGNEISIHNDAVKAYQANGISIISGKSKLGKLNLQLGWVPGLSSNVPLPVPAEYAHVPDNGDTDGFYKANVDNSYNSLPFFFAALCDQSSLVDSNQFHAASELTGVIPTIVRCEAIQQFSEDGNYGPKSQKVRVVACAEPQSSLKARENPGSLMVSFSAFAPTPHLSKLSDIFLFKDLNVTPVDLLQSPLKADYPASPLTAVKLAVEPRQNPPFSSVVRIAFYDWLRRCGPRLNVDSLIQAMKSPWDSNFPTDRPIAHIYTLDRMGEVKYISKLLPEPTTLPVSHKQYRAIAGVPVRNLDNHYDVIIKDFVYQPGRILGGIHGGEPLPIMLTQADLPTIDLPPKQLEQYSGMNFPVGPASGGVRQFPESESAVAVEIQLRRRPKSPTKVP